MEANPHYKMGFSAVGDEIVAAIDGITEECRKARYWYLKGALQELPNLEIENDKLKVEGFLIKLGFSAEMVEALNAAESDYKSTASAFELKNCLSHLRSFLEHLHRESVKSIAAATKQTVVDRWGDATLYLRQQGYFTKQHETFVASLYTLLSDESVHPLTADREYARLLRNVVIEYGVMFLTILDKRGVTI
jgi:arginyl-tRNA synthetase